MPINGTVGLSGVNVHWWVLKDETALTQNSGFVASAGHTALVIGMNSHQMQTGRSATSRLQQFGVIFGHQRVVLYVELLEDEDWRVKANTARTQLLLDQQPLPWADWAAEFRAQLPPAISELMDEITAGSSASDHKQAIRDRLKQIKELFRFSRYRPTPAGDKLVVDGGSLGGEPGKSSDSDGSGEKGSAGGGTSGRAGSIYSLFLDEEGLPGEEVFSNNEPDVAWITVEEGTRVTGFLEDRAAKFRPEQNLLQINGDFRGITDMVDRWCEFVSRRLVLGETSSTPAGSGSSRPSSKRCSEFSH